MSHSAFPMGRMEYHGRRLHRHFVQSGIQVDSLAHGGFPAPNALFRSRPFTLQQFDLH